MTVTSPMHDKKKRAHEAYKSSDWGPAKESREKPNPRSLNWKGYELAGEDIEEMYDELLKHGKIRPLASQRPEEAGKTNHP